MKNFHYKSKVLFWSGLSMLVLAGVIWIVSGGAKAVLAEIQSGRAGNDSNGACSAPGCYSEEWTASGVFGLYRVDNNDTGKISDNIFASIEGTRTCGDQIVANFDGVTSTTGSYCTYQAHVLQNQTTDWPAFLDAHSDAGINGFVTKWQINGHVH